MKYRLKFLGILLFCVLYFYPLVSQTISKDIPGGIDYYQIEVDEIQEESFEVSLKIVHEYLENGKYHEELIDIPTIDSFLFALLTDVYAKPNDKNDILFFIHGMWGSRSSVYSNNLDQLKKAYVDPESSNIGRLISIKWPANNFSYSENREKAEAISMHLNQTIFKLIRTAQVLNFMNNKPDCKIHIITHSLGNFLLKQIVGKTQAEDLGYPYFDELILAAPDLDTDALQDNEPMQVLHKMAKRVHIYYNRKDITLKVSKDLNDKQRMGLVGVSPETFLPDNVYQVDVTAISDDKGFGARINKHFYYRTSPTVTADMLQVFNGIEASKIPLRARSKTYRSFLLIEDVD